MAQSFTRSSRSSETRSLVIQKLLAEAFKEAAAQVQAEQAAKRFVKYANDPASYARDILDVIWWSKQLEIAESVRDNRRTSVYAGHSVGKTHLNGSLVQWFFDSHVPSITLTTAPSWESIHDLLWGEIRNQRPHHAPGRLLEMILKAGPMHYAKGHNAENATGFQGRHESHQLIILDEAMGVPAYIWEATEAMMTSPNCRTLAVGNPTSTSGNFYDISTDPKWNHIHISCLDHPNITAALQGETPPFPKAVSLLWVQEMIEKHCQPVIGEATADDFEFPRGSGIWLKPNDIFRSRVLGLFPKQAINAVWDALWLEVARTANLQWQPSDLPEIGVDVARYGDDMTTLYGRRGPVVTDAEEYSKQSTTETTGRVRALADKMGKEHQVDPKTKIAIKVDDTGVGGGVTDQLEEMGYWVTPINAGETALDPEEYPNRRSELWFVTAERAQNKRLDLSRLPKKIYDLLSKDLRACRWRMQSDKTRRVESKDDYKKRTLHSPDHPDGFNLAFAPALPRTRKAYHGLA